jgi:uncharacterized protein
VVVKGLVLASGLAEGEALVLAEPLSLWGGMDPATGRLIDPHHPQCGALLAGRVVVMPSARGSSSSSSVLAEAVRAGVAPAAIILGEADLILAIGSVVAAELYGVATPVLVLPREALARVRSGARVRIVEDGSLSLEQPVSESAKEHG